VALGWRRSGNAEHLTGKELNKLFVDLSILSNEMVKIAYVKSLGYDTIEYRSSLNEGGVIPAIIN
jgi:hypothetical protein